GAGPGIDRLVVIADGEDVFVVVSQRPYHAVLHGIQVLELVDQYDVPARSHRRAVFIALEELGRFDDEGIEIDEPARHEETLILLEEHGVVVQQRVAAKAMRREAGQRVAMPAAGTFDAPQRVELVLLVGDAEPRLEQYVSAELA